MTELARFRPGLARRPSAAFVFERASLELLARHQVTRTAQATLALRSEWRDPAVIPAAFRGAQA